MQVKGFAGALVWEEGACEPVVISVLNWKIESLLQSTSSCEPPSGSPVCQQHLEAFRARTGRGSSSVLCGAASRSFSFVLASRGCKTVLGVAASSVGQVMLGTASSTGWRSCVSSYRPSAVRWLRAALAG